MIDQQKTVKMRAAIIRKTLGARHAVGSACRDALDTMSDESLVALDESEAQKKIARLREKAADK